MWPVILQALRIMLTIQGMPAMSGLAVLTAHLMELMPCDTGSSWTSHGQGLSQS